LPEYLTYAEGERPPATRAELIRLCLTLPPPQPEGQGWAYSNTNYILLGLLAAEVAGRPCGWLMQDLFQRHGLDGVKVASPNWVRAANACAASPESLDRESLEREIIGDGDVAFNAAGAIGWIRALLAGSAVAGKESKQLFMRAPMRGGLTHYGCGWFIETLDNMEIAHHAGHYDGWTAMAFLNRTKNCGVLALCNFAPGNTRGIRSLAVEALESFMPGATPLGLSAVKDESPDLTAAARRQLMRDGVEIDRECFAEALLSGSGTRGVINLWSGEAPSGFDLVQEHVEADRRLRRYRLTYPDRTEHVYVETDRHNRISWAWPL
jgi:CubicO group peptidase (beta-lactamase class C family)